MTESGREISLAILDPLLYGTARAFDYLGIKGQDMLDRVGDGIVQYGVSEGYFEKSNDPIQFVENTVKFFMQNGYVSNASAKQDGNMLEIEFQNYRFLPVLRKLRDRKSYLVTCPICIADNAITKSFGVISERLSENAAPDGTWRIKLKIVPGTEHTERTVFTSQPTEPKNLLSITNQYQRIGARAFEVIAYGLAYAFDFLGAQAQLLLDNVGSGMIEFMHEEAKLTFPSDQEDALRVLSRSMCEGGLADAIRIQVSKHKVSVDYENSRYLPVLKRLLKEGRSLVSCPFALAARSLIKRSGWTVGEMDWEIEGGNARLIMETGDVREQEFDEEAVGNMMATSSLH